MAVTSAGEKTITAYLKRIIGAPVGQMIPLTNSDVCVGRTKMSDICIQDPNISRSHCTLNYSTDGWFITDLGGVNGTYIDNNKLMSGIPHPLKDASCIYLGPPSESPVAFAFMQKKVEEAPKIEKEIAQEETKKEPLNESMEIQLPSTQPNLKRRANPNSHASRSKKHAPSTSSHRSPVSSQTDIQNDAQDSDTSIHSLDSLKTRIRKLNSHKKNNQASSASEDNIASTSKPQFSATVELVPSASGGESYAKLIIKSIRNSHKKNDQPSSASGDNVASTSASPSLRPPSPKFECVPSTSGPPLPKLKIAREKLRKKMTPGAFKELEELFNDTDSLAETANGSEVSESLLAESELTAIAAPNPCPQSVENDTKPAGDNNTLDKSHHKKRKMKHLNEQLQKAHKKLLKENSEQKKKLKAIEASTSKKEPTENLGNMLEEELICNICTEVFIKATTLGCSHTYCEHCITEWKKKQKRCPICREIITSETRILIMDNFIDKVVEKLDKAYQDNRKEVIASREAAKANAKVKKPKRKKRTRSRASAPRIPAMQVPIVHMIRDNHEQLRQWRLNLLNEVPYHVGDSIELLDMSSDSDSGYQPCHFCGELGHTAARCPRLL